MSMRAIRISSLGLLLALGACGGDEEEAPAPTPATAAPAPAAPSYQAGQLVEVEWNESWYVSRILGVEGNGQYRIHYGGWAATHDTTVPADRIRPAPANGQAQFDAAEARLAEQAAAEEAGPPGAEIAAGTTLGAGTNVYAQWGGQWYEAQVIEDRGENVQITYPGHGSQWDQEARVVDLRRR